MRYINVFFDLDGTITEPAQGITNGIKYALSKYGIHVEDRTELYPFIGPPIRDSFKRFYSFSDEQVEEAVSYYREYYSTQGILENEIMSGMENALIKLKNAGCKLYVATSKPEIYAIQILQNLKLDKYFEIIAGGLLDGSRDNKNEIIKYLLDKAGIDEQSEEIRNTVMVGDRKFDVLGAQFFNMDNIAVTFGYGDRAEFAECNAMKIVDTAEELTDYILSDK